MRSLTQLGRPINLHADLIYIYRRTLGASKEFLLKGFMLVRSLAEVRGALFTRGLSMMVRELLMSQ